jgi:hypothetical protein
MPTRLDEAAHVRGASLADLGGEHWTKPVPPEPDGLVADVDPALGQGDLRRCAGTMDISRTSSPPDG